jgi:hypothetical protein
MPKKINHFIAIPLFSKTGDTLDSLQENSLKLSIWDMLRYDSCYPMPNAPSDFLILMQPYRVGARGGFTIDRWKSFGITRCVTGEAEVGYSMPHAMYENLNTLRRAAGRIK